MDGDDSASARLRAYMFDRRFRGKRRESPSLLASKIQRLLPETGVEKKSPEPGGPPQAGRLRLPCYEAVFVTKKRNPGRALE
jgi:hypothetical protein